MTQNEQISNAISRATPANGDDITIKLMNNFTESHHKINLTKLVTPGKKIIIDLNGFTYKPTENINTNIDRTDFITLSGDNYYNGTIIFKNGTIDTTNFKGTVQFVNMGTTTAGGTGEIIFDSCRIINGYGMYLIWDGIMGASRTLFGGVVKFYNCIMTGSIGIVTERTSSNWLGTHFYFEDCVVISTTSVFINYSASGGAITNFHLKRMYVSVAGQFGTTLNLCNEAGPKLIDGLDSVYVSMATDTSFGSRGGLPFNTNNFQSIDPTSPFYTIPSVDSIMADPGQVDQSTFFPEDGNTVGINGIASIDGNRIIGPCGMPIINEGPTTVTIDRPGLDLEISWVPNSEDTGLNFTDIFIDEYENGDYNTLLATVPFANNSCTIPVADLPTEYAGYIMLKHRK